MALDSPLSSLSGGSRGSSGRYVEVEPATEDHLKDDPQGEGEFGLLTLGLELGQDVKRSHTPDGLICPLVVGVLLQGREGRTDGGQEGDDGRGIVSGDQHPHLCAKEGTVFFRDTQHLNCSQVGPSVLQAGEVQVPGGGRQTEQPLLVGLG